MQLRVLLLGFGLLSAAALCTAAATAFPSSARASQGCKPPATHRLPAANGYAGNTSVFTFGVKGGSLRPWNVTIRLDGSYAGSGTSLPALPLGNPNPELKSLLALADAQNFFSLATVIGCPGSGPAGPDASARFITVHTATGSKTTSVYGSCKPGFQGLFDILSGIAGRSP